MNRTEAAKLKKGSPVCMRAGIKHQGRVSNAEHARSGYLFVHFRGTPLPQRVPVSWVERDHEFPDLLEYTTPAAESTDARRGAL